MRLIRWFCPDHGYLCTTSANATVLCGASTGGTKSRRCNKRAVDSATYKSRK